MAIKVIEGFDFDGSPTVAKAAKKGHGRLTKAEAALGTDDVSSVTENAISFTTGRYGGNCTYISCSTEYIPQAGPVTDYASFGTYYSIPIPETSLDTYGVIGFSAYFGALPLYNATNGSMNDDSNNDGIIFFSIGNLATDYGNIFAGIRASDNRMYLKVLDTAVPIHVSTGLTGTNSSEYRGYHFNNGTCTISDFTPIVNTWYSIEIKYKFSATAGHVLLYVNGNKVAETATNIAFSNSFRNGAFLASMLSLVTTNPGSSESVTAPTNYFDDFYMLDSTGTRNTDYIGNFRVRRTYSTANHITEGYSDGTHYSVVQTDDNDTNYLSINSGEIETFELNNLTDISSRIKGVQYNYTTYFESNNNNIKIVPLAQAGAGQAMHSGFVNQIPASGGGYFYHSIPMESSLISGGNWTLSELNDGYHGFTIFS